MSRILITASLLIVLTGSANAQVNTERMRIGDDLSGFSGSLDSDLTLHKGNVDLLQLGLGGRIDFAQAPHLLFLVGNLRYAERRGASFQNAAFAHLRYNYRLVEWLTYEAFTQIEHNQFTLLNRRNLIGTGLRFVLFRTDGQAAIHYGSSYMWEQENRDVDPLGPDRPEVTSHRWSNYITLRLSITDMLSLVNTLYAQPRFDDFGYIRVLDEATLNVDVTQRVALRTIFSLRHDSRPPTGVEPTDLALRTGLLLRF